MIEIIGKIWRKITKINTLEEQINEWSDEECLMNFFKFFKRVNLTTKFLQNDLRDIISHQILITICGSKYVESAPLPLEWPVELCIPEVIGERTVN